MADREALHEDEAIFKQDAEIRAQAAHALGDIVHGLKELNAETFEGWLVREYVIPDLEFVRQVVLGERRALREYQTAKGLLASTIDRLRSLRAYLEGAGYMALAGVVGNHADRFAQSIEALLKKL